METDYRVLARSIRASKRLGQNFLVDEGVAKAEAEYARGRTVIELGAGLGILTKELCKVAKRVISVEYDKRLFDLLGASFEEKNLKRINADFFRLDGEVFEKADIMVSNIPYNLSSKTMAWLAEHDIPAVLCLQKEFVEHMLAGVGTGKYSKLSIMTALRFRVHHIMDVPASKFYPRPRVDSAIIYLKPQGRELDRGALNTIGLLMMHKKKKLRNAIIDSAGALSLDKEKAARIAGGIDCKDNRVFKMGSELMLKTAARINELAVK